MESIYTSDPVDKTAAIVTNQSGCQDQLTKKQKRENLIKRKLLLQERIVNLKSKNQYSNRVKINYRFELNSIDEELRVKYPRHTKNKHNRDLTNFIVDVVKPKFTKFQWQRIIDEAENLKNQYDKNIKNKRKR